MILASLIFTLRIENQAALPMSHGRLLHAAFLGMIQQQAPDLSQQLHDSNYLSFSVGMLRIKDIEPDHGNYHFGTGDKVSWRVTTLSDELLAAISKIKPGHKLRIGAVNASVLCIASKPEEHRDAVITSTANILDKAKQLKDTFRITMRFTSPATFRYYDTYYPAPRPDLVFGSIVDKWNHIGTDYTIELEAVKQIALAHLIPDNWQGSTRRVNITKDRGITAFDGLVSFNLATLPPEYRQLFVTLAAFAEFSSVGSYTGQGMGQVKVEFRK